MIFPFEKRSQIPAYFGEKSQILNAFNELKTFKCWANETWYGSPLVRVRTFALGRFWRGCSCFCGCSPPPRTGRPYPLLG